MLQTILGAVPDLPNYLVDVFHRHTVFSVILLVIFAFSLVFTNKAAYYLRMIFVIVALVLGAFGFYRGTKNNGYFLFLSAVLALLVMSLVRSLKSIISGVRINRINARIEERALEKAAKRRGSFKNRQGYSGEQRPIVDDEPPSVMSKEEVHELVKGELSDDASAQVRAAVETVEEIGSEPAEETSPEDMETEAAEASEDLAETPAEDAGTDTAGESKDLAETPAEDAGADTAGEAEDFAETSAEVAEADTAGEAGDLAETSAEDAGADTAGEAEDLAETSAEDAGADTAGEAGETPADDDESLSEKQTELLSNLQALLDGGILSAEEFEAKKAELLEK